MIYMYNDIDPGQEAITWTTVDLSSEVFHGSYLILVIS